MNLIIIFLTSFCSILVQLPICFGQLETFHQKVYVNSSELCIIPISPSHFNFEKNPGSVNEIEYSVRLYQHPDLPDWLHYTYEKFNSLGYLYGVPPLDKNLVDIELIALNRYEGYSVRRMLIHFEIQRKNPLEFIVELKIDNLNVRDLCGPRRMQLLLNVFAEHLGWKLGSGQYAKPVYMISAQMIEETRAPLKPNEPEGVVIYLASDKDFSKEMKKLQTETSSLWKLRPCPREMKRTSVERHFRRHNFLIDWCSFRLRTIPQWTIKEEVEKKSDLANPSNDDDDEELLVMSEESGDQNEQDDSENGSKKINHQQEEPFIFKSEIPERNYAKEIIITTVFPGSVGIGIGLLIIALLWADRDEDAPINDDDLFFEDAFSSFRTFLRLKEKKEGEYFNYQSQESEPGTIILTQDCKNARKLDDEFVQREPKPPSYEENHPNTTPALIYAV